jgi:DNA-binding NarL/FixJ family response regulator
MFQIFGKSLLGPPYPQMNRGGIRRPFHEPHEPAAVESPAVPAIVIDKLVKGGRLLPRSAPQQDLLDPLSLRELEVLHLMVQGATNAEIALTLALAVEAIKRHVSNILSKLGVANRTQAAVRAHDLGLLCEHQ